MPFRLEALFHAQAARTPEAVALIDGWRQRNFSTLAAAAERMSGALKERGVGPGSLVGLHLERSCESVAALLGTLGSGNTVLSLPPTYPRAPAGNPGVRVPRRGH